MNTVRHYFVVSFLRAALFNPPFMCCPVCVSGYLSIVDAAERAPLMCPGPLSDGQFYSPPESVAGLSNRTDVCPKTSHIYLRCFLSTHQLSLVTECLAAYLHWDHPLQ